MISAMYCGFRPALFRLSLMLRLSLWFLTMSGSGSGGVLVEGDVEHPVQRVLDGPMAAYGLGELERGHGA